MEIKFIMTWFFMFNALNIIFWNSDCCYSKGTVCILCTIKSLFDCCFQRLKKIPTTKKCLLCHGELLNLLVKLLIEEETFGCVLDIQRVSCLSEEQSTTISLRETRKRHVSFRICLFLKLLQSISDFVVNIN